MPFGQMLQAITYTVQRSETTPYFFNRGYIVLVLKDAAFSVRKIPFLKILKRKEMRYY